MANILYYRICVLPIVLAMAIVAGCNKGEKKDDAKTDNKKAATQVAAKVNSVEITVSQINGALARSPNLSPEALERAKREILDKLIDAEVAKAAAIGKKLDRTPKVVQSLESSKTDILARAYVEEIARAQPQVTPDEAKKYYVAHPELFSERRVFSIEELSLPSKEGLAASLRDQITKLRTLQEVGNWLKSQNMAFTPNSGVRAAEQLPLEILPQMQAMKDGEMRVFEAANAIQVVRIVASKSAPVDAERATPRIQQFLFNQRSTEAITKDIKLLKDKAKVEYVGEFAASAAEAGAKAKAAADAKAKVAADTKAKADAEAKSKEEELTKARRTAEEKDKVDAEARAKEEDAIRARRAAEAKARDAESKSGQPKSPALTPEMEKGLRGVLK